MRPDHEKISLTELFRLLGRGQADHAISTCGLPGNIKLSACAGPFRAFVADTIGDLIEGGEIPAGGMINGELYVQCFMEAFVERLNELRADTPAVH